MKRKEVPGSGYKLAVSVSAGLLGLALIYVSMRLDSNGFTMNFVLNIGFSLLASLA